MPAPRHQRLAQTTYTFGGHLAEYLQGVSDQWLRPAPRANPAMLEIFGDRDRLPRRNLVPWAGEFAGKYLTSAVQILRLTADPALREGIAAFVKHLVSLQAEDGYLGPWPRANRLTGAAPNVMGQEGLTWDAWGHYHVMLGLLLWHEESGDRQALACARRIGDLCCDKFLGARTPRLVDTGSTEMNLALIHSLCLLYRRTKAQPYLDMALQILEEFAALAPDGSHLAGDYLRSGLDGREFFQTPKPRWESLHPIMGLAELYWLTGRDDCRRAFEHHWWSIAKLDRHNNGGFSSGEQAQGNPYHPGAIETCCTIAWAAMSAEMLRLTGSSVVADELELATLNSILGLHSHTGRWVTYNTPMDGVRKASAHDIVFQAREGSPELNCCSVNGPRGLGLIGEWALMQGEEGLFLNWYGPSTLEAETAWGRVRLAQETEYPRSGRINLRVSPGKAAEFALHLRLPYWSARTRVRLNGQTLRGAQPGAYLKLDRRWKRGDKIELDLDMSPHYWAGERECEGRTSVYRGPVLLTYDRRHNEMDPEDLPELDARAPKGRLLPNQDWLPTQVLAEYQAADGRRLRLCDFASAGEGGSPYVSWLKVRNAPATPYSPANPLRSGRT
ncbi:MAG: glycoside hydrolase family 127 protein [Candidatus Handelsmanbacteria bacterium]|nr:glycoside hydrolase family 127 protein [Candidatus Handelsmanbacteria bacterium]